MASMIFGNGVRLNVGDVVHTTNMCTLSSDKDGTLARMVQQPDQLAKILRGEQLYIYRNGDLFDYILKYLRDGDKMVLPTDPEILKKLVVEADYFQLPRLSRIIRRGGVFEVGKVVTVKPAGIRYLSQLRYQQYGSNTEKYICWLCQERFQLEKGMNFSSSDKDYETDRFWGKIISVTDACAMVSFARQSGQHNSWSADEGTVKVHMPTVMLSKY